MPQSSAADPERVGGGAGRSEHVTDDGRALSGPGGSDVSRVLLAETVLVLGVSLGASALWSLYRIVERLTRGESLGQQSAAMNTVDRPDRPWIELAAQLLHYGLMLVPVLLALHLLARPPRALRRPVRQLGLVVERSALPATALAGVLLAAGIGVPGLGLYLAARAAGVNAEVVAAPDVRLWWSVPVLVLAAVVNAVLEEVVVVGYLFTRWDQAGWTPRRVLVVAAVLRGLYHLYQGFGGFVGNIVMGLVFGAWYQRTRRVLPLVIAHALIDIVAFVGYWALADRVGWL